MLHFNPSTAPGASLRTRARISRILARVSFGAALMNSVTVFGLGAAIWLL